MTGPEHYKEAERLLRLASDYGVAVMNHAQNIGITSADLQAAGTQSVYLVGAAQVHATLALVAATAELDAAEGPNGGSATGRLAEDTVAWEKVLHPTVSDVDGGAR